MLQAPSTSLAAFSLSLGCKRFLGFVASIQNRRFLQLCPPQEEHYEPPNLGAQIRCLIRNSKPVCLKEGDREKYAARSVLVKLIVRELFSIKFNIFRFDFLQMYHPACYLPPKTKKVLCNKVFVLFHIIMAGILWDLR